MRAVVQRVARARVSVGDEEVGAIGPGLCVLVGVAANAFATGALSKPHLRYGARIAWLMPFTAALLVLPRRTPVGLRRAADRPAGLVASGPARHPTPVPPGSRSVGAAAA